MNAVDSKPSTAFRLTLHGFHVFPLAQGAKVPMPGSHGHLDATADPDAARSRWTRHPLANIGVATGARSGIWVLDTDPRHGGDIALRRLEVEHGRLPLTIRVLTPSNGMHYWWRWPEHGPEIRNSAGRVGRGIDVRGEGGYAICPPSKLANGSYRWAQTTDIDACAIVPAPAWLVERGDCTLPNFIADQF